MSEPTRPSKRLMVVMAVVFLASFWLAGHALNQPDPPHVQHHSGVSLPR